MEPIELNGKTFCSNCGLTIKNDSVAATPNAISSFKPRTAETVIQPPAEPEISIPEETLQNPITDAARDLFVNNEPTEAIINDIPPIIAPETTVSEILTNPLVAVKLKVSNEVPEKAPEPTVIPNVPAEAPKVLPEEIAKSDDIPELGQKIEIPNEEDFEPGSDTEKLPDPAKIDFNEGVKEVDTLGASGILLDILGKDAETAAKESEIDNLEAAEKLITKVKVAKEPKATKTEKAVKKVVRAAVLADILDGEPQNPIENPELTTEPDELKIAAPAEIVQNPSVPEDDELYMLPHEIAKKNAAATPKIIKEEIKEIEKEIAEAPVPVVTLSTEESDKYDPDTIPEGASASPKDAHKQEIVTDYFKDRLGSKDSKKKKSKKKKSKISNFTKYILITIGVIGILAAIGGGIFFALNYNKPAAQVQRATAATTFTALQPSSVPTGYELSSSKYDSSGNKFVMEYAFVNDKAKTITFTQAKTDDPAKYINDYFGSSTSTYVVKNVDGVEYTETDKGSLLWTKDGFAYIITTVAYDYDKNLLYNMAASLE